MTPSRWRSLRSVVKDSLDAKMERQQLLYYSLLLIVTVYQISAFNLAEPTARRATSLCAHDVSRREWLRAGVITIGLSTSFVASQATADTSSVVNPPPKVPKETLPKAELNPVNLTLVAAENKINITLRSPEDPLGRLSSSTFVDPKTFSKVKVQEYPDWWPKSLRPPAAVVREFTNTELLIAGVAAGATLDIVRSSLLYPIATIKTRIQAVANKAPHLRETMTLLRLKRRILVLYLNIKKMIAEGNLYAGLIPTLLVSVPATGLYFGTRDVSKRLLTNFFEDPTTKIDDIAIALTAALLGDVISLAARTPVDALALRLQVASGEEPDEDVEDLEVGNWFGESLERLPAVIQTDLPYLLSRITVNMVLATGTEDIGRYEVIAITTATTCAILTTPFDVARTRILVDSDGDPSNGLDGGSRQGLLKTLASIRNEGDGGIRNLFAGWFERALYLGIFRAWLDPILLIAYVGVRDACLLEWFD